MLLAIGCVGAIALGTPGAKRSCREQSEQNGRQQSSTHDQILHRRIRNAISWQHRSHWAAVINVDKGAGDRLTAAFAGNGPSKLTVWV